MKIYFWKLFYYDLSVNNSGSDIHLLMALVQVKKKRLLLGEEFKEMFGSTPAFWAKMLQLQKDDS